MISRNMEVEEIDGQIVIDAPWLDEPVVADTFEDAYDTAKRIRYAKLG